MSNFLLFWKRTRVFIKYRFLIYKFHFLKFWGKFIPYFKPMSYTKEQALAEIQKYLKEHIDQFNKQKPNNIVTKESQIDLGKITTDYNELDKGYFTSFKYNNEKDFICRLRYHVKYELQNVLYIEFKIFIDYFKGSNTKINFLPETPFNVSTLTNYGEFFKYIDTPEINDKIKETLIKIKY